MNVWSWERLSGEFQQDVKLSIFMLGVLCIFRVAFIVVLHTYLSDAATLSDIMVALFYGLRISLKSAGLMGVVSFSCCVVSLLCHRKCRLVRLSIGAAYISILSVLFYARLPYYEQFHMGFNQLLFNTFQDDVYALLQTLIQQYNMLPRLALAAITAYVLARLLKAWLDTGIIRMPSFSRWYLNIAVRAALLVALACMGIFIRFGGSMTYAHNIDWENSGVTKDQMLNEAILDDVQALYRAYELRTRVISSTGLAVDAGRMHEYGSYLAGRQIVSDNLDDYLRKYAQGLSGAKPRHVVLIIGESYANWPLLPQYQALHIADGLRNIIRQDDAAYVATFLPNGMSTITGVFGIVAGFADVNLYMNYMPEAYQQPYSTAIAPQMNRLGYRPRFWYGGPSSWERIKEFTLAQGFAEFHGLGDFPSAAGNVWGCEDAYLYQAVLSAMNEEPSFDVILTTSNHAPYTVDLQAEGFDQEHVVAALPAKLQNNQELIKQLGHFWYADKELAEFVATMHKQYPDSLFVIVGDHADRLNLEANPGLYKRYGIPFVVIGKGISKDVFPANAAGSQINIIPTLIELVAPPGFEYYALGDSLTKGNTFGMNYGFWLTSNYIGKADSDVTEIITGDGTTDKPSWEKVQAKINCLRAVSWWRIKLGAQLQDSYTL